MTQLTSPDLQTIAANPHLVTPKGVRQLLEIIQGLRDEVEEFGERFTLCGDERITFPDLTLVLDQSYSRLRTNPAPGNFGLTR